MMRRRGGTTIDERFTVPIYTMAEASHHLAVPYSTFRSWAKGYSVRRDTGSDTVGRPFLTTIQHDGMASIPFVGLVEGLVAAAFRKAGVSLQHIRKTLEALQEELGIDHALASDRLYTDGAQIIYDYAERSGDDELTVVVTGQKLFTATVQEYLMRISYAHDSYANKLILPLTQRKIVEVDPTMNFGRPRFINSGAPIAAALNRFRAGESPSSVAEDFQLPLDDLLDVIRASLPVAA